MDAVSDYAAASAALSKPLPAYVSYTTRAHFKMDAILHDDTSNVVVRTRDGKILKGKAPNVHVANQQNTGNEVVGDPPFRPSCYTPVSARSERFDGRDLEAIALRDKCSQKGDTGFTTLYIDPKTRDPVAATVDENKEQVAVRVDERFARTGAYIMPSSLYVRVKGSGLMFWLDVLADMRYSDYGFTDKAP